jgi:hypothetical protein
MRSGLLAFGLVAVAVLAACGAGVAHRAGPTAAAPAATARSGTAQTVAATAAAAQAAAAQTAAPRRPDNARYVLDLAYDPRRFTISGTERITFRNPGPDALPAVWLRAWANAFGGCRVTRAHVTIRAGGSVGARREDCTALEIRLPQPLAPGADATVDLQIRVTAPRRADRFGRFRGAAYFGNAIPILAVADARGFRLPPYTFAGESFYSLTSAWRVRLRVPARLQVASTGTQTERTSRGVVTLTAPRARDFMLVVGRFAIRTERAGPVRLRRFSFPATPRASVERALRIAALSMRRYAAWYGAYARPELDLVEGPREVANGGVAMEYPELVLTPADPTSVAHELAHQWFYAIVGDDQYREPWLDESFAEFSAARLPRRQVPNRLRNCRLPNAADTPLDARRFDAFMRRLVATHRDGVETTEDFVAAIRAAAPGNRTVERILRRTGLA